MKCNKKNCTKRTVGRGLCRKHYNSYYHKKTKDAQTLKDKSTVSGYLQKTYSNMWARVSRKKSNKAHLYYGLPILKRADFYIWSLNNPQFLLLLNKYIHAGFARKLAPSIDRLNPNKGYTLNNMEWVTLSENSRRAAVTKRRFEK